MVFLTNVSKEMEHNTVLVYRLVERGKGDLLVFTWAYCIIEEWLLYSLYLPNYWDRFIQQQLLALFQQVQEVLWKRCWSSQARTKCTSPIIMWLHLCSFLHSRKCKTIGDILTLMRKVWLPCIYQRVRVHTGRAIPSSVLYSIFMSHKLKITQ